MRSASRLFVLSLLIGALAIGTALLIRTVQQRAHPRVVLTWHPSSPVNGAPVTGYNVYRSTISGGPYVRLATRASDASYTDTIVSSGRTYFYVVTAVDQSSRESSYSNETRVVVP